MHEHLELDGDVFADGGDFFDRKLARQHDAGGAKRLPRFDGRAVDRIGLRADMERHLWHRLAGDRKDAEVGDEQRIDADAFEVVQVVRQSCEVAVMRVDIDGHIDLCRMRMRKRDGFGKLFLRKVAAERPQAERLAAEVDGVGAIEHSHLEFFECPRRREEFGFLLNHSISPLRFRVSARPSPRGKISVV